MGGESSIANWDTADCGVATRWEAFSEDRRSVSPFGVWGTRANELELEAASLLAPGELLMVMAVATVWIDMFPLQIILQLYRRWDRFTPQL